MDKGEVRSLAQSLYADELQYSIARDDVVDLTQCRSRAALRLGRAAEGQDISGVWLGYIEGIARHTESSFEDELIEGATLRMGGAIRTAANRLVPTRRAQRHDLMDRSAIKDAKLSEHASKRAKEREFEQMIFARMDEVGGDPTVFDVCPELFGEADAA